MIAQVLLCLLGLALAALGAYMLLFPARFKRVRAMAALGAYMLLFPARFKRLQWRLNAMVRRRLAWTRLAGMAALLVGTVLFVVQLVGLLVNALFG